MAVFCGRADLMELLLQNGSKVGIITKNKIFIKDLLTEKILILSQH